MPDQDQFNRFAEEATQRFDAFTAWMLANWPKKEHMLMQSDFDAARRELNLILGAKLGDTESDRSTKSKPDDDAQYVSANPMPWP